MENGEEQNHPKNGDRLMTLENPAIQFKNVLLTTP